MRECKVPVVAVGVVHEGRTILARGYGLRDVRRRLPVTEHTVFAIDSCTKAITATAIGILVDEGKLQWDAPIRQYVPSFRLFDPVATEQCTLRDLLCQRTGLPRHDMIWEGARLSRQELFDWLRYLEPSDGFHASVSFMPVEKAGVIVLTNVTDSPLVRLIPYYVFDCVLGLEPIDWDRRFRAEERQRRAARPKRARGRRGTRPSHKLTDHVGTYEHPAYGRLVVSMR